MLGSILGAAKGCVVTPESHFKQTLLQSQSTSYKLDIDRDQLFSEMERNFRFKIWQTALPERSTCPPQLTPSDYSKLIRHLVDQYAQAHGTTDWQTWIDHTPQNIQNTEMLMHLFPKSKFIHLVRDPRAIAASVLPLDWGPDTGKEAAIFWAQKLAYGLSLEQNHPDRCLRVYFEDIIRTPKKTISGICEFCGIEYHDSMLEGGAFQLPKYTQKQHQLVGGRPDPSRLDAWRKQLDVWQISTIENTLGDLLPQMGYDLSAPSTLPKQPFTQKVRLNLMPLLSFFKKIRFTIKKKLYG